MPITARVVLALLVALFVVLTDARLGLARCNPSVEPDRSDVANARAAVAAACDCAGAVDRRTYVRCATAAAKAALANRGCLRAVKRCDARSTCGRPGAVTCCRTRRSGRTSCRIERSPERCRAPKDGSACVGAVPSCCDACDVGGCATASTTSTTSTTTSTLLPPACGPDPGTGACGGTCPSLFDDCVQNADTGACECVLGPCRAIGGPGSCGGTCQAPAICTLFPLPGGCVCIIPCELSGAPPCPGGCLPGQGCAFNPSTSACECAP